MEIEKEKQIREAEIIKPENMSKRQKEIYNRKLMVIVESKAKFEETKDPIKDLHDAYKLILSEQHKKVEKRKISSFHLMEELSILKPKLDFASNSEDNEEKTLENTNLQNKIKNGKQGILLDALL